MAEKSGAVKVLNYHLNRARKHIGDNQPFPSLNQLANRAFDDLLVKLEGKAQKK